MVKCIEQNGEILVVEPMLTGYGNCHHIITIITEHYDSALQLPLLLLSNDNDPNYYEYFHSHEELTAFIDKLITAGHEAWPLTP